MKHVKISLMLLVLFIGLTFQQRAKAQIVVPHSVFGNGGAAITSDSNRIVGTVGQPAIGVISSSSNINEVGFWYIIFRQLQPPPTCQLTITSPRDGQQISTDSVTVIVQLQITGGQPPFSRTCEVNGISADIRGDTLMATIPLTPGPNDILVTCTVVDTLGQTTSCRDSIRVTRSTAVSCQLTILSPQDKDQICTDSVIVTAATKVTGGVPPITPVCDINGIPATLVDTILTAKVPLTLGSNPLTATCIFTDANGDSAVCQDSITVFRFIPQARNVAINEILYDPNYDDLGTERIELKNVSTTARANLDSFALWIRRDTLDTYWAFPSGFTIAPGGLLTVHWLASGTDDGRNVFSGLPRVNGSPFWGSNSANSTNMTLGGAGNANTVPFTIALVQQIRRGAIDDFRDPCRMVDFAQIGGRVLESENIAVQTGLWSQGDSLNFASEGHSYEYRGSNRSGTDQTTREDFFLQPNPSIGFENSLSAPTPTHLLISELRVRPDLAEFVEIFNPSNTDTVDLSNYYLTDNVNVRDNAYTLLVKDNQNSLNIAPGDFLVRFPRGTKIGPGEYHTIAFKAEDFRNHYGQNLDPSYEIIDSDTTVPDMDTIKLGALPLGLDDNDEVVILLSWDGSGDLVQDVDYIVWGDSSAVNKTGLGIDGKDGDVVNSYYDNDTPASRQNPVARQAHDFTKSWQRTPIPREFGELSAGGNGIAGHDDTSERLAEAFREDTPTPKGRARRADVVVDSTIVRQELGAGFPNGLVSPGEKVTLSICLRNKGLEATGPLFAVLRSRSRFLTVGEDSTTSFKSIAPGDSMFSLDPVVAAAVDTVLPDKLPFVLRVVQKFTGPARMISRVKEILLEGEIDQVENVDFATEEAFTWQPITEDSTLLFFRFKLANVGTVPAPSTVVSAATVDTLTKAIKVGTVGLGDLTNIVGAPDFDLIIERSLEFIMTPAFSGQTTSFTLLYSWGVVGGTSPLERTITWSLPDSFIVSGQITYYSDQIPIENAMVTLTGPNNFTRIANTDTLGEYGFTLRRNELPPGAAGLFTLSVMGPAIDPGRVTIEDLNAATFCAGTSPISLTPFQRIAANLSAKVNPVPDTLLNEDDCSFLVEEVISPGSILSNRWAFIDSRFPIDPSNWHQAPETMSLFMGNYNIIGLNFIGIVLGDIDGMIAGSASSKPLEKVGESNKLPETFSLDQNYPNPFNAGTRIEFQLPVPSDVKITVSNIMGQHVITLLLDRSFEAGYHRIDWNGKAQNGQPVASGIYIYTMRAGDFVQRRKMLLMR